MFSRRGYNIDSLTVGETLNPEYSRMTIAVTGEDDVLEQIEKQLNKLIDVKEIVELPAHESVCRELIMIKVECGPEKRQQVSSIADIFRANIVEGKENYLFIDEVQEISDFEKALLFPLILCFRQILRISDDEGVERNHLLG